MQSRLQRFPSTLLACGALLPFVGCPSPPEQAPPAGSTEANGDGGQAACLPPPPSSSDGVQIVGVVHLDGVPDAINLALEPDGVARLTLFGCDFCGGWFARWTSERDVVVVLPSVGHDALTWIDDVGIDDAVSSVRLSRAPGGWILARVESAATTYEQAWFDGRTCAKCCGELGPTGRFDCAGPAPSHPCDQGVWWSCTQDCAL